MKINYSINLAPPTPAHTKIPEKLVEYAYDEFLLALPEHWKQHPTSVENSFDWQSSVENAAVTVSADFYDIPDGRAMQWAEVCLNGRNKAMEALAPGQVTVFQRSVKPYSGGHGLELAYAAQTPDHKYLYLGYVTARKIFNFGLTCGPDKLAAIDLFNKFMQERLRVKIP